MKEKKRRGITALPGLWVSLGVLVFAFSGCPMPEPNGPDSTGKVTTAITAESSPGKASLAALDIKQGGGPVPVEDIESLKLTITEIVFDRSDGEDDPDENGNNGNGPGEEDKNGDDPNQTVVFSGALEVDLMDLRGVSEVISSVDVSSGTYSKIRMGIANPRLILASDPNTEITDVHLTANSRLFVSKQFEIPEGQDSLILLDFGGIHIVGQGQGGFVLTPQLDASIEVLDADVSASGEIVALDTEADTFTIALSDGSEVLVAYGDAELFLPLDGDTPTGIEADLLLGAVVDVQGTLFVDGSIQADTVFIHLPEVSLSGEIESVNAGTNVLTVTNEDESTPVFYRAASVFLPGDTDTPTGTEADLTAGTLLDIEGFLRTDGLVLAEILVVQ